MSETSLSQTAVYSARPTLRIAGQEDPRLSALVTLMRMEESEGGMSTLELHVSNWVATGDGPTELAFDASSALKLGADLGVYGGDAAGPCELFKGKVSALELVGEYGKPLELVVLAEDALTVARHGRRSMVFVEKSPADVVKAVAAGLGLQVGVDGLDSPVATWAQINETDLGFLRRLLARFDADLQVVGETLQVSSRQDAGRAAIDLTYYHHLARVRFSADLAHQASAVTVAGWNDKTGAAAQGSAGSIAHAGPGSGKSGVDWLSDVFGTRSEHLSGPLVSSDDEATAVAQAAFDQRARRFVRAQGLSEGNPRLRVGSTVAISGVSPQFDNSYYVVSASHIFDTAQGYRTEFSAECAYLGGA